MSCFLDVVVFFVFAPSSPIIFKMMRLCSLFVLFSGRDQLLRSEEEGQRLNRVLPKCQNRSYSGSGHFLLLVTKTKSLSSCFCYSCLSIFFKKKVVPVLNFGRKMSLIWQHSSKVLLFIVGEHTKIMFRIMYHQLL
jgi:hypothetical protein